MMEIMVVLYSLIAVAALIYGGYYGVMDIMDDVAERKAKNRNRGRYAD